MQANAPCKKNESAPKQSGKTASRSHTPQATHHAPRRGSHIGRIVVAALACSVLAQASLASQPVSPQGAAELPALPAAQALRNVTPLHSTQRDLVGGVGAVGLSTEPQHQLVGGGVVGAAAVGSGIKQAGEPGASQSGRSANSSTQQSVVGGNAGAQHREPSKQVIQHGSLLLGATIATLCIAVGVMAGRQWGFGFSLVCLAMVFFMLQAFLERGV